MEKGVNDGKFPNVSEKARKPSIYREDPKVGREEESAANISVAVAAKDTRLCEAA